MVSYPSLRSHAGENRAGPPNINTKQQIALQSAETGPRVDPSTVFSLIAEKGFLPIVDSGSIEAICDSFDSFARNSNRGVTHGHLYSINATQDLVRFPNFLSRLGNLTRTRHYHTSLIHWRNITSPFSEQPFFLFS